MADDASYYPPSTSTVLHPSASRPKVKPPRPPNAWILFRADQAKCIPKGAGAPQQSEVSKTISQLWRDAPPEVKEHYERMADLRKQQHALQYPDYRFQPVKKEDKDRMRVEKKAEREASRGPSRRTRTLASHRYAPYAASDYASTPAPATPASTFPTSHQSYYPGGANYQIHGTFGPTPPMSAASSPGSTNNSLPETPIEQESESPLTLPTAADLQEYSTPPDDTYAHHSFVDFSFGEFHEEQTPYSSAPTPAQEWNFHSQVAPVCSFVIF